MIEKNSKKDRTGLESWRNIRNIEDIYRLIKALLIYLHNTKIKDTISWMWGNVATHPGTVGGGMHLEVVCNPPL